MSKGNLYAYKYFQNLYWVQICNHVNKWLSFIKKIDVWCLYININLIIKRYYILFVNCLNQTRLQTNLANLVDHLFIKYDRVIRFYTKFKLERSCYLFLKKKVPILELCRESVGQREAVVLTQMFKIRNEWWRKEKGYNYP